MEIYRIKFIGRREVFNWTLDYISFYISLDKGGKPQNAPGVYYLPVDDHGFNSSVTALKT